MTRLRVPPGPSSAVPGRLLFRFVRNPLRFLESAARTYGDIVYFKIAGRSHYLLNTPEFIKDVMITRSANFSVGYVLQKARVAMGNGLVNSEGPLHARQRRLVQRSFHKQRLAGYSITMIANAQSLSAEWRDGETRDVHADMVRLTLNVVMKTLFNIDRPTEVTALGGLFKVLVDNSLVLYVLPYPERLLKLPIPRLRAIANAMRDLDSTIYGIVAERRHSEKDEGDLLSEFVAARDIEHDGQGMSDQEVRDECVSTLAAGHETVSSALAWTLYLLARHPAVEERLHDEVWAVFGNRDPTLDDYGRLSYAKAVLSESLRLYPPAWHLSRRVLEDCDIGGFRIPAGSLVLMIPWIMHRDPRYFPDPERFDPGRFAPDATGPIPAFCYFPFGGGVRSCVGEGFAWLESVFSLAVLVRDWQFRLTGHDVIEPQPSMILRPTGGLPMTLHRRGEHPSAGGSRHP